MADIIEIGTGKRDRDAIAEKHGIKLDDEGGMSFKFTLTGTSYLHGEALNEYGDVDMEYILKHEKEWIKKEAEYSLGYMDIRLIDIKPING